MPNNTIVLPQDVGPAALVMGLDVESLDLATLAGRGARGEVVASPGSAEGAGQQARAAPSGSGVGTEVESLHARVRCGELSQDSVRALMLAMRAGAGGGEDAIAGGGAGRAAGGSGGDRERFAMGPGGQLQQRGASAGGEVVSRARAAPRLAVVFVVDERGTPEPRAVQIVLNDWDRTEIVSGVAEGERVALLGGAQLQAQQQEFLNGSARAPEAPSEAGSSSGAVPAVEWAGAAAREPRSGRTVRGLNPSPPTRRGEPC